MKKRTTRKWHKKFIEYMNFIANHPNYNGMPHLRKEDGSIRWVVTGKSEKGQDRLEWWDQKRKKMGIKKEGAWISKVARKIHPTGEKPCQICGKIMKLNYVYPNKRGGMSPGAMSNAPDRLDGYHSYNLCCRSKQDTGRSKSNLSRYGEDRRVYENWSDGDWKAASWLMKVFTKNGVSPDHIGPISLGFAHRPKFNPLTRAQNSAKNNRMNFDDVKSLLEDEKKGNTVVSYHSKFIWDKLKNLIKDDVDALKLSKIMRLNMHHILMVFYEISFRGYKDFLIDNFLHPKYANYSIKFIDFNPEDGSYSKMIKKKGDKKQYKNNAERYIRKSFESLDKYSKIENRNTKKWKSKKVDKLLDKIFSYLENKQKNKAKNTIDKIFQQLADEANEDFLNF